MKRRELLQTIPGVAILPTKCLAALLPRAPEPDPTSATVYELRVYQVNEGKLQNLIKSVAYWLPTDEPAKSNTLIYILEHPSREAAAANWKAFQDDPEWKSVRDKSEENGKLVDHVDSTYMTLTDFSKKVG